MEFLLRNIDGQHIFTYITLTSLFILVVTKLLFPLQFENFLNISQRSKYLNLHTKSLNTIDYFNGLLFLFLTLNSSLFIHLVSDNLGYPYNYLSIFVVNIVVVLTLLLIQKICFEIIDFGDFFKSIVIQQTTLNHYIGFVIFIINLFLIYITPNLSSTFIYLICILLLSLYVLMFVLVIASNLKLVLKGWFYFILYLCTFKISPILLGVFLLTR